MSDIDRLRERPLGPILESFGLTGHKEGQSVKYTSEAHAINVTGLKWFDHKHEAGGYGAIDLAIYLKDCSFKDACAWLGQTSHDQPAPILQLKPRPPLLSFEDQLKEHAYKSFTRWPEARKYLVSHRGLPSRLVDSLYAEGKIFATEKGSVGFFHENPAGKYTGCTLRSFHPDSQFKQSLGDKSGAWFIVGRPDNPNLVAVESPIEALSFLALHPGYHVSVVSVSGNHLPQPLLDKMERNGQFLYVGLNNDPAGHLGYAKAIISFIRQRSNLTPNEEQIIKDLVAEMPVTAANPLRKVFPGATIPVRLLPPIGKDWNQALLSHLQNRHRPSNGISP
jgi:hypothetical protein